VLALTLGLLREEIHVAELDGYVLDRWHIGLVTEATVPRASLARLAASLGGQSLVVDSQLGQRWVWIGKNEAMTADGVEAALTEIVEQHAVIGLGEPRRGLSGWRLTHTEARSAAELPDADGRRVTRMRPTCVGRCART
jgi:GGDEF-like domain